MTPNSRFTLASRLVNHTGRHLFLTGRAGTGKTTFLRYIRQHTTKKTVVVAPTGVAAINAGGVTMHSFFQLPLGMYLPDARLGFSASDEEGSTGRLVVNRHTLFKNIRFNKDKIALLRELELLVIDEVSMLRADALDAIDAILRQFRRRPYEPFGGVQVLYIGDLYQLPPVVTQAEAPLMAEHYRSHFFFGARVLQDDPPLVLELDTIYRQSDGAFISLLNNIRSNSVTEEDVQLLLPHYQPHRHPTEGYITLTTHNSKADDINRRALEHLPGAARRFDAVLSGDFPEKAVPAERELALKIGAQIMFIVNDKGEQRRYFNGKLATVSRITADGEIYAKLSGEEETELKLEHYTWKNIRYKYNDAQDDIEEEDLGSYSQFPVRLAWAITIHKSQGLTFERAVVDAGQAFAPGQVYVALSRLTALDGLILHSKLSQQGIQMPPDVVEFCSKAPGTERLERIVEEAERRFASQQLVQWFSVERLTDAAEANHLEYNHRNIPDAPLAVQWSQDFREAAAQLIGPSKSFMHQLEGLLRAAGTEGYGAVSERVTAASAWFSKQIDTVLLPPLKEHFDQWKGKSRVKKYLNDLTGLEAALQTIRKNMAQAVQLAAGLAGGAVLHEIDLRQQTAGSSLEVPEASAPKPSKGDSSATTLRLFREGKSILEIAKLRGLAASTIEGHLTEHISTGELSVDDLVPAEEQALIGEAIAAFGDEVPTSTTAIKEKLPEYISHSQVRAVLNHRRRG